MKKVLKQKAISIEKLKHRKDLKTILVTADIDREDARTSGVECNDED